MSSSDIISIPTTSVSQDNVVYYNVNIKVPLRSSSVQRRYSEFSQLVDKLCYELGINNRDFPYKLPPKSNIWSITSKVATVNERQKELAKFLNELLKDKDLQNHPLVHEFLQLPITFKISNSMFEKKGKSSSINELVIPDVLLINAHKWLEYSRLFKYHINELRSTYTSSKTINVKVDIRDKINKIIHPNLSELSNSLYNLSHNNEIDKGEYSKRELLLESLRSDLNALVTELEDLSIKKPNMSQPRNRRVLGGKIDEAEETKETLPLNNKELLQHQLQIHQQQDQDVSELRKIIQRQREIGQTINAEVEEQNALLDEFNEDVDRSNDKLRLARKNARKIL